MFCFFFVLCVLSIILICSNLRFWISFSYLLFVFFVLLDTVTNVKVHTYVLFYLCECGFIAIFMLLLNFGKHLPKCTFLLFSVIPYGRRLKPTLSSLHEFGILFLDYLYVVLHSCCSTFHYSYVFFVLLLLDSSEG